MTPKGALALVFSMMAVAAHAQQPSRSSGFPVFRLAEGPLVLPPMVVGPQQSPQPSQITPLPAPGVPAGNTETIMIGGKPRSYVIERPAIAGRRPTIFILHGASGAIRELRDLPQLA